ncbi:ATP-binding cassette domain-containing protein [Rhodococcoides kyotonense]|uniref:ABC-2 type transport system ATP-binding protein n=1 Tax=Rhodococcoides kyotonense TaxID=398843 RepID=A0A239J2T0_9NOCA|nr:ATP-binding cassette domain-containing protein [Rhodococcus kyotonensis]SNT00137.1 ABC-2 type transport system ATP-binding protein [Rhodococcus kyotonensis]
MTIEHPPAVECVGLTHRYGDFAAVDDLSLTIEAGEAFALLGPNGAGKTTTIRVLNTLTPIQQGSVKIFGLDISSHAMDVRYNIGYVPQQLSIESTLTGRQNVAWFARLFDVPRRERAQRVDQALESMDLLDVADRMASTYSGGMVRRLELAQALVNRPALLVLDEPTVGLDPIARDSVWEVVAQMREKYGMTVLLTTHYMEEADVLCDRVALMHRGRLQAVGAPADLKRELGVDASLEDVFRHYAGADLAEQNEGGMRNVRSSRRTA